MKSKTSMNESNSTTPGPVSRLLVALVFCFLAGAEVESVAAAQSQPSDGQIAVPRIEQMPNLPQPFKMLDWKQRSLDFDAVVFSTNGHGKLPPLVWIDQARRNFDEDAFGLYTSAWESRGGPDVHDGEYHESLNTIGAVLGASLVGINKSNQGGRNWVSMCRNYFNSANGWNIVMNFTSERMAPYGGGYSKDFWYDLYPNILFYQLADRYPQTTGFTELLRKCANQMERAVQVLKDAPNGFRYTYFNFAQMQPMQNEKNGNWVEPDCAAGFAWLLYAAHEKFGGTNYLDAAETAMRALLAEKRNPYYEVLMPFGAYTAARMNAELGRQYDTEKLINWCFAGDTPGRGGDWGAVVGRWGEYDISGLIGAPDRVFFMNTVDTASALVPLVRYDARFAHAVGKWMLNAANASRLFYPDEIPDRYQAIPELKALVKNAIAYEAMSPDRHGQPIFADRDDWGAGTWGPTNFQKVSNFTLYGTAHVGIFGGIISKTSDEKILQLDCLKTDFFRLKAYPTHLVFNPYPQSKQVTLSLSDKPVDLYDLVSHAFIKRAVKGQVAIKLSGDSAIVIVQTPVGGNVTRQGAHFMIDGVVVDYQKNNN
jgi:hypothetical protein